MSSSSKVEPTFIMIGPGRTGSSWMYEMLLQHPEVCLAQHTKETLFFNREFEKGIDRYFRFFDHCSGFKAVGELSTTYFHSPHVPERIHAHLPQVRLVTCLREPMERMISAFYYRKRAGETVVDLEEAIQEEEDLLAESLYDVQLKRFLEFFPKSSIHILFYDDLKENPQRFLQELYQAVGVSPDHMPEGMKEMVNRRSEERIQGTGRLLGWGAASLRKVGAYRMLDFLKRDRRVRALFLKEKPKEGRPSLSSATREWLNERFDSVTRWVEDFVGRDLEHWKAQRDEQ